MIAKSLSALMVALLALVLMPAPAAHALGIDIPKPKKDKEKKKEGSKKEEAKKEEGKKEETEPAGGQASDAEAEVTKGVEPVVDKALNAYNADDSKAFFADYSKSMAGIANSQTYQTLYGRYKQIYGKYVSRTLVKARTSIQKEGPGLLSYDGVFEKVKNVRIDVNYLKEDGAWKLMQVQFNSPEGEAQAWAPVAAGGVIELKVPKSTWATVGGDLKAGDWTEYENPTLPGYRARTEVLEVGDHFYVMLSKTTMNGQTTEQKTKMIFSEPDPDIKNVEEKTKVNSETKEFADKVKVTKKGELATTRYEYYLDGKLAAKSWTCKQVPLGGLVRAEDAEGNASMVLVDFGRK